MPSDKLKSTGWADRIDPDEPAGWKAWAIFVIIYSVAWFTLGWTMRSIFYD